MSPQATAISPASLIAAAEAPILAYNDKNWNQVKGTLTPDFVYDEVPTQRKTQGADQVIALWQGWATAFPDSKGTIENRLVSGTTVVLELTWRGTHKGQLQLGSSTIAPTGKTIEIRACQIVDFAGEKPRAQRHYFDMATLLQQLGVG